MNGEERNNGFKEFVRAEIKNVKDAAERNYDEHKTLFGHIAEIKEWAAGIDAKLGVILEDKKSKRAMWAIIIAAFLTAAGTALANILGG